VVDVGATRALVVGLGGVHEVLSWALVNGGRCRADAVVWREVRPGELGPDSDARRLMRETLVRVGRPDAVGLLTARDVRRFEEEHLERDGVRARCVVTVGLGNALAAGDPTTTSATTATTARTRVIAGTINVLCAVSAALSEEALLEALALATEARTAALMSACIPSVVSGRAASGTGTDCVVIAAPAARGSQGAPLPFAGKHTPCGSAIGAAVHAAVERGVRRWVEENACRPR
jgi:adenosylcobinamide amidohydrolase